MNGIEAEGLDVGMGEGKGQFTEISGQRTEKEQPLWAPRFQTVLNVCLLHTNKLNLSLNVSNNKYLY